MAGKKGAQDVADEVDRLLGLARGKARPNPELAKKYVSMARALAMRHRIPLGRGRKMQFCRECLMPLIAGYNLKVRLKSRGKKAQYICKCGSVMEFPYGKKR